MSLNTWSQYLAMEEPLHAEARRLEVATADLAGWDDDFDLGDAWRDDAADASADAE